MVTGDAGIGATQTDLVGNTDSYATGDMRIPDIIGVCKRNGHMKDKDEDEDKRKNKPKKRRNVTEESYMKQNPFGRHLFNMIHDTGDIDWTINEDQIDTPVMCVTKITTKRVQKLVEDLVNIVTPKYYKSMTPSGNVYLKFEANENNLKDYSNRLNALLGDTLNKKIFVHLETNKPGKNEQLLLSELYESDDA